MKEKKISRRGFLKMVGAGVAGASAGPFILRHAPAAEKQVVVCSWGGTYQKALRKAFFDPFEKETGIKVVDTSAPLIAKVKAQVDAKNVEWDVIESGTRWYYVLVNQGLVQKLDMKKIDTSDIMPEAALSHGVAPVAVSMNIAYNTKLFPGQGPNSWADFWDVKKFPGPRSYMADVTYALEFALLADGVPADKLYPVDVERAFRKLEQLKPHIKVFWKQADQPIQIVSQGEVAMAPAWNGRVLVAREMNLDISLAWNQGSYQPSYFFIMNGAPNQEAAYQFINFICKPKPQADLAMEIPYGPTNTKALELIPAERQKSLPTSPQNMKLMWPLNGEWLGKNYDEINDRWQKFMIS